MFLGTSVCQNARFSAIRTVIISVRAFLPWICKVPSIDLKLLQRDDDCCRSAARIVIRQGAAVVLRQVVIMSNALGIGRSTGDRAFCLSSSPVP
jgi:hypothetical protein